VSKPLETRRPLIETGHRREIDTGPAQGPLKSESAIVSTTWTVNTLREWSKTECQEVQIQKVPAALAHPCFELAAGEDRRGRRKAEGGKPFLNKKNAKRLNNQQLMKERRD